MKYKINYIRVTGLIFFIIYLLAILSRADSAADSWYANFINSQILTHSESSLAELASALLWLLAAVTFIRVGIQHKIIQKLTVESGWLLSFAMLCILAFGEEISWGDHLFNYDADIKTSNLNAQGETNVHNLNLASIFEIDEGSASYDYLKNAKNILNPMFYAGLFFIWVFFPFIKSRGFVSGNSWLTTYPSTSNEYQLLFLLQLLVYLVIDILFFNVEQIFELFIAVSAVLTAIDMGQHRNRKWQQARETKGASSVASLLLMALLLAVDVTPGKAQAQETQETQEAQPLFEWQPRKITDGISVYSRKVAGSDYQEFKAVTEIQATVASALALLNDTAACSQWLYRCVESHVITQISNLERTLYQVTKLPFPAKSRDAVFHANVSTIPEGKLLVTLTARPELLPATRFVRIQDSWGSWLLEPLPDGTSRLTWQQYADPAGALPAWLVNSMLTDLPFNSLAKFRNLVTNQPYRDTRLGYDKEGMPNALIEPEAP